MDGSLYATILKSPRSPLKSPLPFPPAFISNIVNNNHSKSDSLPLASTPKERTSSTQSLISPPPEFSNKKLVEIKEFHTDISPIVAKASDSKPAQRSYTSTPTYEEIQLSSRTTSRDPSVIRHYSTTPRSHSSLSEAYQQQQPQQPEAPQRSSSVSRAASLKPTNAYLRPIDTFNYGSSTRNGNFFRNFDGKVYCFWLRCFLAHISSAQLKHLIAKLNEILSTSPS